MWRYRQIVIISGALLALATSAPAQTLKINLTGLYCALCAKKLTNDLQTLPGVTAVQFNTSNNSITIAGKNVDPKKVQSIIDQTTYRHNGIWLCANDFVPINQCDRIS